MKKSIIEIKADICDLSELCGAYQSLVEQAKHATEGSYAPYSEFKVGAALLLDNGETVTGANQENSAYPSGLCAERTAVFYANAKFPNAAVKAVAIAAFHKGKFLEKPVTPCGACRQVLLETEQRFGQPIDIILYGTDQTAVVSGIYQMLPLSFGKSSMNL